MKLEVRKRTFFLGALWNEVFALSSLAMPEMAMKMFSGSAKIITDPLENFFFMFYWIITGILGVMYYLISRDPDRNDAAIWTGCLAKTVFFVLIARLYIQNHVTILAFLGALGDLVWAFLFLAAGRGEKEQAAA